MRSYSSRSKWKNRLPPFVAITYEMLNSHAFIDLPGSSAKALLYFLGKVKISYRDPNRYVFNFSFPYAEAKRFGFATGTHHRVISQLMEKGFIDHVYKGGKRSFGMSSSLFKLSERWKQYGASDFKKISWRDIMPEFKKQKATSKMETYNTKKGAGEEGKDEVHF